MFSNPDKLKFLDIFSSWGYKILEEDPYTMIKKIDSKLLENKYFYASVGLEDRVNHLMLQQWIDIMGRMKKKKCIFKGYLCRRGVLGSMLLVICVIFLNTLMKK